MIRVCDGDHNVTRSWEWQDEYYADGLSGPIHGASGVGLTGREPLRPEARCSMGKAGRDNCESTPRRNTLPSCPWARSPSCPDGGLLTVDESVNAMISRDDGQNWEQSRIFQGPKAYKIRPERALMRTREGTVILAFANDAERANWQWNVKTHDSPPNAQLPTYAVRSLDDGKTWDPPRKLHDDWTGAIRDMIQTRDGTVVFTSMMMRHKPGRHAVVTYASKDQGQTWKRSNVIDLGGIGHHGGVTEATLVQLADNRLWMLLRTNWHVFWQAFSPDDGSSWMPIGPTTIDASAAPGILERLESGRIFLAWNRYYREGTREYPKYGGDMHSTGTPTSLNRQELSIAFSADEGKTWTEPIVVARMPKNNDGTFLGGQVSYPYVFERRPGEIWLTSWPGALRVKLLEQDFAGTSGN